MKKYIKIILRNLLHIYHSYRHLKQYKILLRQNGIKNSYAIGEKEWKEKWSIFNKPVNSIYYRIFSTYIGNDINIIPEDICHDFIEPILNPPQYTKYYADKNIFDRIFPFGYLPKTLLRKINGFWYDENYNRINRISDNIFFSVLNQSGLNKVFIKPAIDSSSGKGVIQLKKKNEFWFLNEKQISFSDIDQIGRDLIIQEAINQHSYLRQFNSTSVNTIRLTLYRSIKTEKCVITSGILRIGGKGSIVDNAHAGGGFVGINIESGKLYHEVLNQWGKKTTLFNDIDFKNDYEIPNWNNIITFAQSIGQYIPHHRLIALDIVLKEDGKPAIIEINVEYYGMWAFQFTTGGAFGNYTDEILEYCKRNIQNLRYTLTI